MSRYPQVIRMWRDANGYGHANVPHAHRHHSTDKTYEWGYLGSGPADLALNILASIFPLGFDEPHTEEQLQRKYGLDKEETELTEQQWDAFYEEHANLPVELWDGSKVTRKAWDLHQVFKFQFISKLPKQGGEIKGEDIRAWVAKVEEAHAGTL